MYDSNFQFQQKLKILIHSTASWPETAQRAVIVRISGLEDRIMRLHEPLCIIPAKIWPDLRLKGPLCIIFGRRPIL